MAQRERREDACELMPRELREQIPALYGNENIDDPTVWVKWFTPDSSWTWYVTEYDPIERVCFGLVDGQMREMGYFSLDEVERVRGPLGLRVERDLYFEPRPLSAVRKGR